MYKIHQGLATQKCLVRMINLLLFSFFLLDFLTIKKNREYQKAYP